jgi:hypothetical protein
VGEAETLHLLCPRAFFDCRQYEEYEKYEEYVSDGFRLFPIDSVCGFE